MSEPKTFRDRLTWDLEKGDIHDGPVRYLLIRPDTLMGIFARLEPGERARALEAFKNSTIEHGTKSASRYQQMGNLDADALFATIHATSPQLGWGRWTIERDGDVLNLAVRNSPFAADYEAKADRPLCAPIAGMFTSVSSLATGRPMQAEELECVALGAPVCRFRARPA
jgi:predicted hydrocarbon binding protein